MEFPCLITNIEETNASKNEITVWNTNIFMPWIENKYFYQTACSDIANNTAEIGAHETINGLRLPNFE